MELKSLIDQPGKLPTIPRVTQQLIASFSSEETTVHDIGEQLTADPALSAKLLRLANSAFFHVSRTIGTVEDALRMLGFVMVRNLVLGNGMAAAFKNTPGIDLPQFWRYNLYTASASRWLAHQGGFNGDMAFTLGLMHAIGQLQMHAVAAPEMAPLDKKLSVLDGERAALETKTLGFHFGEVSAELAKIWNFPQPLVDALRDVPDPLAAKEFSEAAGWVHLGAWRARAEVLEMTPAQIKASYPAALAKRLGLEPQWMPVLEDQPAGEGAMPALKDLVEGLDAMLE